MRFYEQIYKKHKVYIVFAITYYHMETEQFNFRISKSLMYDLEFIARVLNIQKTEYVKMNLAKIIANEKENLLNKIENQYVRSWIDDKKFKELTGLDVPKHLIDAKQNYIKDKKTYLKSAKRGILEVSSILKSLPEEDQKEIVKHLGEEYKFL